MEAINKALSRCGFFLIGETDFKKTTAQILEIYRRRDVVEKSFDNLKNDIDMRRLYVQSDEVAEGKMFTAFIALIVRIHMQNQLSEYMSEHKFTFQNPKRYYGVFGSRPNSLWLRIVEIWGS